MLALPGESLRLSGQLDALVVHFEPPLCEYPQAISAALDAGLLRTHCAIRRKALGLCGVRSCLDRVNFTPCRVQTALVFGKPNAGSLVGLRGCLDLREL